MSYHHAKFYGHRDCYNGYGFLLVCHMISQDRGFKMSRKFVDRDPSSLSHHCPKFSGHGDFGGGEIMILVGHVIFRSHLIKVHVTL